MINVRLSRNAVAAGVTNPVICLVRKFRILPPGESALDSEVESILSTISKRRVSEESYGRQAVRENKAHLKLLQNFYKNGFRRHNNLVDAANIASLEHGVSIGLHDASSVTEDILIDLSSGGETLRPLFKDRAEPVAPSQLIYKTGDRLLAWIGKKDVDADDFRINSATHAAMIVVLGTASDTASDNRRVCLRVLSLLRLSCPQTYGQIIPTIREQEAVPFSISQ